MASAKLTGADRRQIDAHGIGPDSLSRQLELLAEPPAPMLLDRPCTVGDGVRALSGAEQERLGSLFASRAPDLRPLKFVPASGAASRMFKSLMASRERMPERMERSALEAAAGEDSDMSATLEFVSAIGDFAFRRDLDQRLRERGADTTRLVEEGRFAELIGALLDEDGLDYAALPKGLLKFHGSGESSHTALEEHLTEAAAYARGSGDVCRLHFTVSPQHREGFEAKLAECIPNYEASSGARYDVKLSAQKPSTDSVAVDENGELFRLEGGDVLFRPGGHGALIENLNDLDADVIFVKNIDNVVPAPLNELTFAWKRTLGGLLLELQSKIFDLHVGLAGEATSEVLATAEMFVTDELGITVPRAIRDRGGGSLKDFLVDRLDRPLRVCGMVRNTGEPGGGPFWVREGDGGVSAQVVESSQVDPASEAQQGIFNSSTHFNPVDLVCGVRDHRGAKYDLRDFVDPRAVFMVEKSQGGRYLRSLELPGLWNGAMAGWNTVFVEVPIETFNPVKQVNDLLRPAHCRR